MKGDRRLCRRSPFILNKEIENDLQEVEKTLKWGEGSMSRI
jgi:hypothetical protein